MAQIQGGYVYDANGTIIQDTRMGLHIEYNCLNLLSRVCDNEGNVLARYYYSADGRKLAVRNGSGQEGFDYAGSLIYCITSDVRSLAKASFGAGQIVATTSGTEPHYFIKDQLGSVRVVFDNDGAIVEQNDYYPFGERHLNSGYAVSDNLQRYVGQEVQAVGNLGYLDFGFRQYDQRLGRWFTPDLLPEQYPAISPYVYALNNPISLYDILGLSPGNGDYDPNTGTYIIETIDVTHYAPSLPFRVGYRNDNTYRN